MNSQQPHPGCYNREPFRDTMIVMNGKHDEMDRSFMSDYGDRHFKVKRIPATGSKECHANEPRCVGCKWLQLAP